MRDELKFYLCFAAMIIAALIAEAVCEAVAKVYSPPAVEATK